MPPTTTPVPEIESDSAKVMFPDISKVAPLLIVVPLGFVPRANAFDIVIIPLLTVVEPV